MNLAVQCPDRWAEEAFVRAQGLELVAVAVDANPSLVADREVEEGGWCIDWELD